MKKNIGYLILSLSLMPGLGYATEPGEALPSPYFIDEVHCEGINVRDVKESWLLAAEEVEPARKNEQAEMCEQVFHVFGIQKYEWLSPDDLERTATVIRQSGYFQDVDLSIRKSELVNHVHIFLKVKPSARFTESIANEFRFYAAKSQGSPRLYNSLASEVTDHRYAPITTYSYGINLMGTSATSPMTNYAGTLTPDDLQKTQIPNDYLADLYFKSQGSMTKYLSYDVGFHVDADNTYSDNHSRLNLLFDGDILLTKHLNIVNGKTYIGPAFISTSYTPYQVQGSNSSRGVILPGVVVGYDYGQTFANKFFVKMAYYHSSADQSILQMDIDLQKHIGLFDSYFIFGLGERYVNDAVLPQDRFPLSAPLMARSYIGLSKIYRTVGTTQQVSAIYGSEQLSYANSQTQPAYQVGADYVGLRYKILDGTWNISLAASYYFNRNY